MLDQEDLDFVCKAGAKGHDISLQKGNVISRPMLLLWA